MKAIRLSELVQQGRLARNYDAATTLASRVGPPPLAQPSASSKGPPRLPVSFNAADKIERLALQLLSISKSSATAPEVIVRQALLSIEQCIVSIGSRH